MRGPRGLADPSPLGLHGAGPALFWAAYAHTQEFEGLNLDSTVQQQVCSQAPDGAHRVQRRHHTNAKQQEYQAAA